MSRLFPSRLRWRLFLLVAAALLPAVVLSVYAGLEQRAQAITQARSEGVRAAQLISADHERLLEGARQLLVALARVPEVRSGDQAACRALLADLLREYRVYANFGTIDADGISRCSAVASGPVDLSDRPYYERVLATHDFAVGEFQMGRLTGRDSVNFAYPIVDDDGGIHRVVFAALDLDWLGTYVARAQLPPAGQLTLLDRQGTVLARVPATPSYVGQPVPEPDLLAAAQTRRDDRSFEAFGADGVLRLYSLVPLGGALGQSANAFVALGVPTGLAFADADRALLRDLSLLSSVALLALVGALWLADAAVVRPVGALVAATRRLSRGELTARSGLAAERGEIGDLARAFDGMAAGLEEAAQIRARDEDLRRRNFALEQQNRSVEEASHLKTEFVSMVSHELRTPLTSVLGHVDLLLEGAAGRIDDEPRRYLAIVKHNADRLHRLVGDLLDLSRIEAGRLELRRGAVDLVDLAEGQARAIAPQLATKRQQISVEIAERPLIVWADPERLGQIVDNLLSNAHKYTPPGGQIVLSARRDGDTARVEVRDTGVGIGAEDQARLFTRFYRVRTDATQNVPGVGLGLAITRMLVEMHGGTIRVESQPGAGSTFVFAIPLASDTTATPVGDGAALAATTRPRST